MLTINDLKTGTLFVMDNEPYEVLSANHLKMGRGGAVLQTKIKRLKTGNVLERNFKPAEKFEEAELDKKNIKFIYSHRGEYIFSDESNKRINLSENIINEQVKFLKQGLEVEAIYFKDNLLNIVLPIKVDLKVTEAPPSIKGNTSQGGTKTVTVETGAQIKTPLFIEAGDEIRINTKTGEYVERIK